MFNRDGSFPINLRGHVPLLREHQPHEQPQDNLWGLANTWEESWVFGELIFSPADFLCFFGCITWLSSPTGDLIHGPCSGTLSPNHWTTRGMPCTDFPIDPKKSSLSEPQVYLS